MARQATINRAQAARQRLPGAGQIAGALDSPVWDLATVLPSLTGAGPARDVVARDRKSFVVVNRRKL